MDRLVVRNFGPLKHADIEVRDVNVFIGPTGSGKSTLAKLVAIFTSKTFNFSDTTNSQFLLAIGIQNISGYESDATEIEFTFHNSQYYWRYKKHRIDTNYPFGNLGLGRIRAISGLEAKYVSKIRVERLLRELMNVNQRLLDDPLLKKVFQGIIKQIQLILKESDASKRLIKSDNEAFGQMQTALISLQNLLAHKLKEGGSVFIPAERIFFSVFTKAIENILTAADSGEKTPFPGYINNFAYALDFASAVGHDTLVVPEMGLKFHLNEDLVFYETENGERLAIQQAASGIQSLYPALKVIESAKENEGTSIIIEELELNLFPNKQDQFVKYLVKNLHELKCKVVLTTHSPYVLTALDNLILAGNVAKEKPRLKSKISSIVPEKYWLDFNKVSAYFINPSPKRGKRNTESILNEERKGIGGNAIDGISEELSETFERLNDLKESS